MDPFGSKSKKKYQSNNFIEALKDIGSSFGKQAKDATFGTGRGVVDQLFGAPKTPNTPQMPQSGELTPDKSFNFEDFLKSREKQIEYNQRRHFEKKLREEKMIFHHKEEEAKMQIKNIQEELKKLAQETAGLSQEIKKAVFAQTVNSGAYHINFFDRIRRVIELARKQICESKTWFESFNQRKKQKQNFYWHNVKKSGTKYMLSQERTIATQSG